MLLGFTLLFLSLYWLRPNRTDALYMTGFMLVLWSLWLIAWRLGVNLLSKSK